MAGKKISVEFANSHSKEVLLMGLDKGEWVNGK